MYFSFPCGSVTLKLTRGHEDFACLCASTVVDKSNQQYFEFLAQNSAKNPLLIKFPKMLTGHTTLNLAKWLFFQIYRLGDLTSIMFYIMNLLLTFLNPSSSFLSDYLITQNKGKESENSYQKLKRSWWTGTQTHTRKQNWNILTDTAVLLNQKKANVCEHTTKNSSDAIFYVCRVRRYILILFPCVCSCACPPWSLQFLVRVFTFLSLILHYKSKFYM